MHTRDFLVNLKQEKHNKRFRHSNYPDMELYAWKEANPALSYVTKAADVKTKMHLQTKKSKRGKKKAFFFLIKLSSVDLIRWHIYSFNSS